MALTWEDVLNKQFQHTKFREGYDQDEVDDFLDAVAEELKRLHVEIERLRAGGAAEAPEAGVSFAPGDAPAQERPELVLAAGEAEAAALEAEETAAPAASDGPAQAGSSAAAVLAMAQRLHDEHVADGEQRRAALIAEAEATAAEVLGQAEETKAATLAELASQRSELESEVERLRGFETDYRLRLTAYIEGQLREIRSQERVEPRGETA
ncbi:DivIVA domain-containing protein [Micrococcus sp. M4NT]|uniref:DivIVA domain-containing protein n=1 Tax=Micrococcus sp. M4NT TaxID=2957501 RepID=UPI0029B53017|nr:DivIVA domain-containing protein [Micrococcus sp. M4NT]MDX2341832.1 DivIVA domain-containing protein [Micrococcus sp. M4NT]